MDQIVDTIDQALTARLRTERQERKWSMQELANRSNVSKAMIGRIEKGEVSPTANLLCKLADAFGMTLSTLLARAENGQGEHHPFAQQQLWTDPETSYVRRSISPPGAKGAELTHVTLPPNTRVHFEEQSQAIYTQQIIVVTGQLTFDAGHRQYHLRTGDWFQAPDSGPRTFINNQKKPCQYMLVVT